MVDGKSLAAPAGGRKGRLRAWLARLRTLMNRDSRELEHLLRLKEFALDHAREAVYLIAPDLRFIYVNDEACRALGYRREELVGLTPSDINPDYPPESARRVHEQTLKTGSATFETRHRRRDGSLFPVEVQASSFEYQGRIVHISLVRDISERKRAEAQLAQREREFRSLAENMPDNIARWDTEGRYLYINPTHERTLGMAAAELIGKPILDTHEQVKMAIEQVVATGQPVAFVRQPALDGEGKTTLHDVSLAPEWDEAGNLVSVLGLGRDMTDICRMQEQIAASEQALREQADFQKTLLDAMSEVGLQVMVVENGKIIHVGNREIAHTFGYSDAELDAHPALLDIVHPDDRARVADSYRRRLAGEAVAGSYELGLVTQGGERREYETAIAVVPDTHPIRIVTVGKDISERKALENALKESEAQYRTSSNLLHSIFESSPDVITFALDTHYRYIAFNSKHKAVMQAIWGKEIGLGMNMLEVIGQHSDRDAARQGFDRALSGESFVLEEAYGAEHLSRQHWQNFWSPIRSDAGAVIGLTVFVINITERKALENALAQREREFRTLAENSPDPIFRYDRDCRRLYVNPVAGKLAGKPVEELIGNSPADGALLGSEQSRKLMDAIRRVLDSGENEHIELFIDTVVARRDYHVRLAPERDAGGGVATVLVMARDITALRDAERRMTSFLANFPGFAYSFRLAPDGHASFPFASPGIEKLYGLQPDDVKDDMAPVHALAHPDDRPLIEAGIAESARTLAPFHVETRVCRPGLPERWIEVRSVPLREDDGSLIWHGLMIDIDERKRTQQRMELLDRAIDMSSDAIYLVDEQLRFTYVNAAACHSLGYSRAELLTMGPPDIDPDATREFTSKIMKATPIGSTLTFETRHRTKDGQLFPVELNGVHFEDGGAKFGLSVVRDITERKRMENALRKNRESLNEAQRIAQVGSWELDLADNVLTWSDEIFRIFEIDPQQFGASYEAFLDAIHPDDRAAVNRAYLDSLESRAPYQIEHRLLMPDGRIKHVHERCESDFGADGKPLRSLGTVQDISERKRLEEQLAKRERQFRTLAENSPDIVVRYDRDCRFVYANPQFQKRLGHTMDQLRGKRPTELPGLLEAEFIEPRLQAVLQTGIADEFEHRVRAAGDQVFWGLVHILPEFDESGRVAYAQVLTRDITALKEAERAIAESRKQLRELAMQRDFEQEEEHKRLAWEVHEGIGQNLIALRMRLQLLGDGDEPRLRERAGEMLAMVDDAVRLARDVTIALRPRVLDFGLNVALEWLAGEFGKRHDLHCAIELPEIEDPMGERVASLLFRVAEETLSYIARRGGGKRVHMMLEKSSYLCRITLREKERVGGVSLPADEESFGLAWIEAQITAMAGEFVMFSLPGQGLVVEATLPMRASS